MAVEDPRVRVVEDCGLHAAAEERLWLPHEELVERVLTRHEHRQAVSPSACPAPLLAKARDRPGESDRDRTVEQSDVDAELERIRRRHSEQLALDQSPLDLTPLGGRVPGPVGREPRGRLGVDSLGCKAVDQLRRLAALGEADRPQAARDELREQSCALAQCARPKLQGLVEHGRVPEGDRPGRARSGVVVDHGRIEAEERTRQLAGVGDRRRGEQELRLRPVDLRCPPEPPQDVSHVRAEDTAVDVRLVDDDVAEVGEDVGPAVVVREHSDVEHVRVGQDRVSPFADLPAAFVLGVAVVDRRLHARNLELRERAGLILGERLRWIEVEGAQFGLGGEGVQHRQIEGERLPAGRPGRDDEVLAAAGGRERLGLVGEERLDAPRPQGRFELRV